MFWGNTTLLRRKMSFPQKCFQREYNLLSKQKQKANAPMVSVIASYRSTRRMDHGQGLVLCLMGKSSMCSTVIVMACYPDEPPKHVFYLANDIQKNTRTPTTNEVSVRFLMCQYYIPQSIRCKSTPRR
jgi:hypothetical protein